MITRIQVEYLTVGMYIIIPQRWQDHPFMRNQFLVKSEKQLDALRKSGVQEFDVDTSRSETIKEVTHITHEKSEITPPEKWDPDKDLPDTLRDTINDTGLEPQEKAHAVYEHSIHLMKLLFEKPTAEFIGETKNVVGDIVDLILHDDDTAQNMLNITSHDFYTYTHSVNVGILSVSLAKQLYVRDKTHDMRELGAGFFLHDLGKTKVPPEILNKPARLTDDEMAIMRCHPYQSYKILEDASLLSEECGVIAMQHHEREDGTGYPRRLKGDEIHDYGRICCIADIFDAMTAERSYKRALSPFQALRIMKEEMLGHFHEEIFRNFVLLFQPGD